YHRIHAIHSMNPAGIRACRFADITDQIGCLADASPCSLGVASRAALVANPATVVIKVDRQDFEPACIRGGSGLLPFRYPLSRKLYLTSRPGFAALDGEELQLAGCEPDLAQILPLGVTPAGLLSGGGVSTLRRFGLIDLPSSVNAGHPYCEDFNEQMLCGAVG